MRNEPVCSVCGKPVERAPNGRPIDCCLVLLPPRRPGSVLGSVSELAEALFGWIPAPPSRAAGVMFFLAVAVLLVAAVRCSALLWSWTIDLVR